MPAQAPTAQNQQSLVKAAVAEGGAHLGYEATVDSVVQYAERDVRPVGTTEILDEATVFCTMLRDLVMLHDHVRDLSRPLVTPGGGEISKSTG